MALLWNCGGTKTLKFKTTTIVLLFFSLAPLNHLRGQTAEEPAEESSEDEVKTDESAPEEESTEPEVATADQPTENEESEQSEDEAKE